MMGTKLIELQILAVPACFWGRIPIHPPAILAAHREEEVESVPAQVDVELALFHRAGRLGVGDEVRFARGRRAGERKCRSARAPDCAQPSHPATHAALSFREEPSGSPQRDLDMARLLLERGGAQCSTGCPHAKLMGVVLP